MTSPAIRSARRIEEWLLPLVDVFAIFAGLWLVEWTMGHSLAGPRFAAAFAGATLFLIVGHLIGLYRDRPRPAPDRELLIVLGAWSLVVPALSVLEFFARYADRITRSEAIAWTILAPMLIGLGRMLVRVSQEFRVRNGLGVRRVAVAGLNRLGLQVAQHTTDDPSLGLQFVGFYDDRLAERLSHELTESEQPRGTLADLVTQCRSGAVDIVMIALPMRAEKRIQFVLDSLSDTTASVYIVPDFFVFELLHSRWTNVGGIPTVSVFETPVYGVDGALKRALDLMLSVGALAAAAIPMLLIAGIVKLTSPGPVFFRQRRYGLDGREIMVWKFRTMTVCEDGSHVKQATKNDSRITRCGSFLRRSSLDELPQLFNVLGGSMSLVGPRPHATAHNEQYRGLIRGYMLRHKVRPGITGLAQVNGCRGETDTLDKMRRRVELDHRYIRDWSLGLDVKILWQTLWIAWRQPEAY
jgi:putative colanic acid biosynthesis UDP-glucose lipid carrier transferase